MSSAGLKLLPLTLNFQLRRMNKSLLKELPGLVTAGVITQETAERIILHYQQEKQTAPNNLTIILGILGAVLAGSGVLLIVAHNWDDLSVTVKTVLAFLPLLLAQLACAYTLSQRKSDATWRECSSLFLFFGIGKYRYRIRGNI